MSETLIAALVGALVGGGFAVLGGVVVHFLNLREDRIKRERDQADKRAEEVRKLLKPDSESLTQSKVVSKLKGDSGSVLYSPSLHLELELPELSLEQQNALRRALAAQLALMRSREEKTDDQESNS